MKIFLALKTQLLFFSSLTLLFTINSSDVRVSSKLILGYSLYSALVVTEDKIHSIKSIQSGNPISFISIAILIYPAAANKPTSIHIPPLTPPPSSLNVGAGMTC